jgi:hypothetical protein
VLGSLRDLVSPNCDTGSSIHQVSRGGRRDWKRISNLANSAPLSGMPYLDLSLDPLFTVVHRSTHADGGIFDQK